MYLWTSHWPIHSLPQLSHFVTHSSKPSPPTAYVVYGRPLFVFVFWIQLFSSIKTKVAIMQKPFILWLSEYCFFVLLTKLYNWNRECQEFLIMNSILSHFSRHSVAKNCQFCYTLLLYVWKDQMVEQMRQKNTKKLASPSMSVEI
jgi:hypothetical protein